MDMAIDMIWINRFNNYCNVASLTLLSFDYILTVHHEIEYIWESKWNLVKILFLLTRYLPFIDCVVVFIHQFTPDLTGEQCAVAYQYSAWMFVIGITIAELLLTIRAWAVWEKDRRLTIMLAIFFASFCVVEWVMMGLFLKPLEHVAALQRPWIVCGTLHINQLLSGCWVVLMVYDAAIFSLIAVQAWRTFRSWGDVPLTRIIYHDGIIYFAYLFCEIANQLSRRSRTSSDW
ncbi:hypothetical protein AGABI1DRAFT_126501 [Agaricus bisporus var. burnettii JB137-S8]|uniref:DUF6533 domain-containing protein n=1 Tax=Agaricus bisporus var. burnettii (strain JB137-S8 / ATCC MYA-4627 / FGSC 10392) TaxID=597362 RepID=K5XFI6_AGABU|nr:uncharacterized protein AGABI1DRAFT_126501 [Agaricus bisporus var. burnettii JB137-S8]EKM82158.1 hypothetical protein AGABI1DRAFT_126501 [Agaricus bisporus var. burnettii JB137-S8]